MYSGGLDTSCILQWLIDEGYDAMAYIANIGQYKENFEAARDKALKIGASKVFIEDVREEFLTDFVYPSIQANGIYEDQYLMGTSLARYPISKRAIELAKQEGAEFVSHGATGKGNDQVRFELSMYALAPHIKMVVPWRDPAFLSRFEGRQDLIEYAEASGIPVTQTKAKSYSTDENMFHISYESGILEDANAAPPQDMFVMTNSPEQAPDQSEEVAIEFEDGIPVKVTQGSTVTTGNIPMFELLNDLGMKHGIGRVDIVENRFVGIKSRGVYETPGGSILRAAHIDLEGITMDREVRKIRDSLAFKFSELAYNGFWFSPEMEFLLHSIEKSQERVTGTVKLGLYKGNVTPLGRDGPFSLYDKELASMDVEGGYNPTHAEGFIKINALRLRTYRALVERMK